LYAILVLLALLVFLSAFSLLADQVLRVHIELVADVLVNLPVREERKSPVKRMRFCEGFRIFERDFHLQVA